MCVRRVRAKIPPRLLLPDPFEERLQQRRKPQLIERGVKAGEVAVGEGGVQLLVARFAERRAISRGAALLPRRQMMQRDQPPRNLALA